MKNPLPPRLDKEQIRFLRGLQNNGQDVADIHEKKIDDLQSYGYVTRKAKETYDVLFADKKACNAVRLTNKRLDYYLSLLQKYHSIWYAFSKKTIKTHIDMLEEKYEVSEEKDLGFLYALRKKTHAPLQEKRLFLQENQKTLSYQMSEVQQKIQGYKRYKDAYIAITEEGKNALPEQRALALMQKVRVAVEKEINPSRITEYAAFTVAIFEKCSPCADDEEILHHIHVMKKVIVQERDHIRAYSHPEATEIIVALFKQWQE